MKKMYNNPVTEVTLIKACSVLSGSGDQVNNAPSLTVTGTEGKANPKTAAF